MFAKWIPADGRFNFSPSDNGGVEITDAEWAAALQGEQAGQRIDVDTNGKPVLVSIPASAPPALSCNAAQIRLALNSQGLRSAVESAVAAGDQDLKDLWAYSPVFRENDPHIAALAVSIGQTPGDVHALFALAVTL